ncbi:CDP-alcohol phosphatidyltransferase family protein [Cellulomonas xiejunii]|uniref:CDP-alcohol phosphatidyltransferase family protein n=1 Tax=Cellulomonas xiejunii TaxID=2968083 RepID=UPI001D0F2DE3|nr:CDP-alcohol phosphatidyltransferase family protein [Cellulomonas xiejunii]MCC2314582.1 CDP-alcohol phosphatidyltransferase family protein [Cellulomonas xiejunii]
MPEVLEPTSPVAVTTGLRGAPGYRWARAELAQAQKPGVGVPAYTRWVNRRAARVVAAAAVAVGAGPNVVTAVSVLSSAAGMAVLLLLPAGWWTAAFAAGLLALGYVLDSADGQVARVTRRQSPAGEWLDHVADAMRTPALHLTVAVAWVLQERTAAWVVPVALTLTVVVAGQFMSQILAEQLARRSGGPRRAGSDRQSWVLLPTDPGVWCWVFLLWGDATVFAVAYTALAVVNGLHVAVSMRRRFRELSGVAPAGPAAG